MRPLVTALLLLPCVAKAYESPESPVVFADEVDVWSAVEFDTGPLPAGSPVTVRFFLASDGGAYTAIDSASLLSWPTALAQEWASYPGGGSLALVTDLSLNLELSWDVFGFTGTEPLWSEGLFFEDAKTFDGLALPGSNPETVTVEAAGGVLQSFSFRQLVVTGVEVAFEMDLLPAADATLTGSRIDVTDGGSLISTDFEGDVSQFDVPASHPGWIEFLATYQAELEATLALVLTPSLDLCLVGQCFELAAFDIPIDLIDTAQPRSFAPVAAYHPLPSLIAPDLSHDFGDVLVGNTLNFELPLANQGEMYLEGWVEVVGAENITVFPQYFFAQPGEADGVMVSFAPNEAIETTAILRITSNDPLLPELEIPLRGAGTDPDSGVGTSEDGGYAFEGRSLGLTACGCAHGSPASLAWLALTLPLWVRRRRP